MPINHPSDYTYTTSVSERYSSYISAGCATRNGISFAVNGVIHLGKRERSMIEIDRRDSLTCSDLPQAIELILPQTLSDFELIVSDDYSTEDSFEVATAVMTTCGVA
jgi:hypothetical protein